MDALNRHAGRQLEATLNAFIILEIELICSIFRGAFLRTDILLVQAFQLFSRFRIGRVLKAALARYPAR